MKRTAKAILLSLTMAGLLAGCQNQDAIENTIENTDEQLTYRADDTVKTEVSGNEIGDSTEPPKEPGIKETEEDNAESIGGIETKAESSENTATETVGTEITDPGCIDAEKMTAEDIETDPAQRAALDENGSVSNAADSFYYTALTEEIKARITGSSYPDTQEPLQISYEDLSYVHVLHYDFEGQIQEGELICNQVIAQDLVEIFYELYECRYPIEKIRLIDEYNADDEASMADNNTSCFNYRTVPGRTKLSNHSYGLAIDINPLYNPYVRSKDGKELISPDNAGPYADRSADFPHKIDKNDLCYKLFIEHEFKWGGAWNSSKDYQHFEKTQ